MDRRHDSRSDEAGGGQQEGSARSPRGHEDVPPSWWSASGPPCLGPDVSVCRSDGPDARLAGLSGHDRAESRGTEDVMASADSILKQLL